MGFTHDFFFTDTDKTYNSSLPERRGVEGGGEGRDLDLDLDLDLDQDIS